MVDSGVAVREDARPVTLSEILPVLRSKHAAVKVAGLPHVLRMVQNAPLPSPDRQQVLNAVGRQFLFSLLHRSRGE